MDEVISRLEAVASRLEASESNIKGRASSLPASQPAFSPPKFAVALPGLATPGKQPVPAVSVAPASRGAGPVSGSDLLADWDAEVVPVLQTFIATADIIGGDVLKASQVVEKAFQAERNVISAITQCKAPDQAGLQTLIAPVASQLQAAGSLGEGRQRGALNHNKVVIEALQSLSWVLYTGPACGLSLPAQHIEEAWQSAEFYANKVLMEFRSTEPAHVSWVRNLKDVLLKMKGHVQKFHSTGPAWNAAGIPVSALVTEARKAEGQAHNAAPIRLAPPPPPPIGSLLLKRATRGAKASTAGLGAVFSEINKQGAGVTSGLKKVTDDMKTKNRAERTGAVSASTQAATTTSTAKNRVGGPPRVACEQGRKWVIENQDSNKNIILEDTTPKQTVYIYRCNNSTIQVKGKLNAITIDECTKTGVVFEDLVAACELVNSSGLQVQVTGLVPTVAVDKCDGIQLYLSEASMASSITTAKSSAVNVLVPGKDGEDMSELYIPEQFVSSFKDGRLVTEPVSHSGG